MNDLADDRSWTAAEGSACCGPEPVAELPDGAEADAALARLAKGLAHPVRVRILRLLATREGCFCGEIVDAFELAQSTISQHLKILKEAGLVRGEVEGPATCYCLSRSGLALAGGLLAEVGQPTHRASFVGERPNHEPEQTLDPRSLHRQLRPQPDGAGLPRP
ncbi:MAG: metalloregulator ArsR/SmtB family transcription factor [Holophagales bacterium]|nr:metalloregulator ArsR/SmtB family transcription factor [Holophagales bacterium]